MLPPIPPLLPPSWARSSPGPQHQILILLSEWVSELRGNGHGPHAACEEIRTKLEFQPRIPTWNAIFPLFCRSSGQHYV